LVAPASKRLAAGDGEYAATAGFVRQAGEDGSTLSLHPRREDPILILSFSASVIFDLQNFATLSQFP
jgi:hypothetical protein